LRACISVRYPIVETRSSLPFAATTYSLGLGQQLLLAFVLIPALIALAAMDLEHRLLPNVIVGSAALLDFARATLGSPEDWWLYLLSLVSLAAFRAYSSTMWKGCSRKFAKGRRLASGVCPPRIGQHHQ